MGAGAASGSAFECLGPQLHILGPQGQPGSVGLTLAPGAAVAASGDIHATSIVGGAKITNNLYLNLNTNFIKQVNARATNKAQKQKPQQVKRDSGSQMSQKTGGGQAA